MRCLAHSVQFLTNRLVVPVNHFHQHTFLRMDAHFLCLHHDQRVHLVHLTQQLNRVYLSISLDLRNQGSQRPDRMLMGFELAVRADQAPALTTIIQTYEAKWFLVEQTSLALLGLEFVHGACKRL